MTWLAPWVAFVASAVDPAEPARVGAGAGIAVDGALDEPSWQAAPPITTFVRYLPTEGDAPPGRTEVRFLQDERHLYVGVRVVDTGYPIRARVSPREDINADDQVGIYLDTFHDGRSGYVFYLNPLGIQQDIRHSSGTWVIDWNTAFRSAGRVLPGGDGYEIEVAFPWRSLKFPARRPGDPAQTWGIILTRKVPHEGAKYAFPTIHLNRPVLFSEEAELRGVEPPRVGSGVELVPSVTAVQRWAEDPVTGAAPDFDRLQFDPWWAAVRPSLDARLGITPDLGLTATVNPDFSQVEADTADVRLNPQFAFQFPELRPFFLDGVDALQDPAETLYTRSIADPLAGLKLTGRTGPVSIGLLSALDRSPLPSFTEGGTPGFDAADVRGRWAEDTVGRVRVDALGGGLVGITLADKRLVDGPGGAERGAGAANDVVGVDVSAPLGERWLVSGAGQASWTVDGAGASTFGEATQASIARSSGIGTGGGVFLTHTSPDFRRETGFQTQAGLATAEAWLDHTFAPPGRISTIVPEAWGFAQQEVQGDHYREVGFAQEIVVDGIHTAWASVQGSDRRELGVDLVGWRASAGYAGQVGAALEWSAEGGTGRLLDFGALVGADAADVAIEAAIRATRATRLDLRLALGRHHPDGFGVETARLVRARLNWQFTRPLGARLIVQDDRVAEREGVQHGLLGSALLTWLDVPGTAVYLGYTERLALGEAVRTTERTVFAKVSVLVRP